MTMTMTPEERWRLVRRWAVFFAFVLLVLMLMTACGNARKDENGDVPAGDNLPQNVNSFWVKTVDGRRIPCIWASSPNKGGLSCDWSAK
jgi:hypothetical protein